MAVSRLFWRDRKVEKARSWCNRAVTLDPDLGDAWGNYYAFELQHGVPEQQQEVLRRCIAADPHHGDEWTRISKDTAKNLAGKPELILKAIAANMGLGKYTPEALENSKQ